VEKKIKLIKMTEEIAAKAYLLVKKIKETQYKIDILNRNIPIYITYNFSNSEENISINNDDSAIDDIKAYTLKRLEEKLYGLKGILKNL